KDPPPAAEAFVGGKGDAVPLLTSGQHLEQQLTTPSARRTPDLTTGRSGCTRARPGHVPRHGPAGLHQQASARSSRRISSARPLTTIHTRDCTAAPFSCTPRSERSEHTAHHTDQ